ncbi:hypothetical protein U472_14130 [Orenia metallireducens]|uniref:MatE protein n=2 Tax=Orenia metallireducens TaxID=1413210 RepID=A0A1C0A5R2_9FIRM|nr:hypothetical protein U472_14130 [Orenia metallireducens]
MGVYTDNSQIILLGISVLMIGAFLEPRRNFNVVLINSLRGAGDGIFPVVMAIISTWGVAVLGGYFFGVVLGYGLPGIWIGMTCDEWIRGIYMLARWHSRKWTKKSIVG